MDGPVGIGKKPVRMQTFPSCLIMRKNLSGRKKGLL
jgi:hypothetical protein